MDWKAVLGTVAPLAATALGGPLAGLVVGSIGKAIGLSEPTVDKVKKALADMQLTSEQIIAIKQAEADLKVKMRELDISEEQLAYQDTDSARKMQIAQPSLVVPILAVLIVAATATAEGLLLFGNMPKNTDPVILGRVMGTLDAALMLVLSFYFGSSHSSERKTDIIASMQQQ